MNFLLAIVLSIPFLNLLVGTFVGLRLLGVLLQSGSFKSVFFGLVFAALWCLIAMVVVFAGGKSGGVGAVNVVAWVIHIGYSFWLLNWVDGASVKKANSQIEKLRAEYQGKATFKHVSGMGAGPCICFDSESKLVAFVYKDSYFVKPITYVREWQSFWTTRQIGSSLLYEDVKTKIVTSDMDRPVIEIPLPSRQHADELEAKLSILTG